jgi:predicted dehydrogenase
MRIEKIKLGQIGNGYWGRKLHRYFSAHHGFEITRVAARDYQDILADKGIAAVIVATPLETHFAIAKKVLTGGKHLFCEKAFTATAAETEELQADAGARGLKILVDFTFTFSRGVRNLVSAVQAGQIGNLASANLEMRQLGRFRPEGVYFTLGSHMLSVLNMIRPLHEFSFSRSDALARDGRPEAGRISFAHNTLPFHGSINLSLRSPEKTRKIEVQGSRGTLVYDMFSAPGEMDNLALAVGAFYQLLAAGGPSNIDSALEVARALDKLSSPLV